MRGFAGEPFDRAEVAESAVAIRTWVLVRPAPRGGSLGESSALLRTWMLGHGVINYYAPPILCMILVG